MKKGENEVVVFEMEDTGKRNLQGLDKPILDSLGIDKNKPEKQQRNQTGSPILEEGDILLNSASFLHRNAFFLYGRQSGVYFRG